MTLTGRPADALVQFAREHEYDLIVIAPRGRGASRVLFGSVASRLAARRRLRRRNPAPRSPARAGQCFLPLRAISGPLRGEHAETRLQARPRRPTPSALRRRSRSSVPVVAATRPATRRGSRSRQHRRAIGHRARRPTRRSRARRSPNRRAAHAQRAGRAVGRSARARRESTQRPDAVSSSHSPPARTVSPPSASTIIAAIELMPTAPASSGTSRRPRDRTSKYNSNANNGAATTNGTQNRPLAVDAATMTSAAMSTNSIAATRSAMAVRCSRRCRRRSSTANFNGVRHKKASSAATASAMPADTRRNDQAEQHRLERQTPTAVFGGYGDGP